MVCVDVNVWDELEEHSFAGLDAPVRHSRGHPGCPGDTTDALDLALLK